MGSVPIAWSGPTRVGLSGPDFIVNALREAAARSPDDRPLPEPSDTDSPRILAYSGTCPYCGKRLALFYPDYMQYYPAGGIPYIELYPGFKAGADGVWRRVYSADQLYGNRGRRVRALRKPTKPEHLNIILDDSGTVVTLGSPLFPYEGELLIVCPGRGAGRRSCDALVRVLSPTD